MSQKVSADFSQIYMKYPKILLIDDQWGQPNDPQIKTLYGKLPFEFILESSQDKSGRFTADIALARVRDEAPNISLILLDVMFGLTANRLGVDILEKIRNEYPSIPVLMFTSLGSGENRELLIRCMELGANEYIEKAPSAEVMGRILSVYLDPGSDYALYGNSYPMRKLRSDIARVSFSGDTSVLVIGESGTGKELIARTLYRQGKRKYGPFVAKNCAYSDSQLLESELFGHEKGAFTGAVDQRVGLLEEANGGVLFLDEIADMPEQLQGKLLRALESRSFRRIGGNKDLTSSFQLISATNRIPDELIRKGKLRQDFFYRISPMSLQAPPLKERAEDIGALAEYFISIFKQRGGASYPGETLTDDALNCMKIYHWPGNVRELRNVIERAVILSTSRTITVNCLPPEIAEFIRESKPTEKTCNHGAPYQRESVDWPRQRILDELHLALDVKRRIFKYKGSHWKAEFMRVLYPECKAQNAKGFNDVIRRLTKGPWGDPNWQKDYEIKTLLDSLCK